MTKSHSDLDAIFDKRHSCRRFLPKPVAREVIEKILNTAQKVPSWCNAQPWQIIVTSGVETENFRKALYHEAQNGSPSPDLDWPTRYTGVYQERRRTCGWQLYEAVGVEKGDREGSARQMMENFTLFDAPHCAIITTPADLGNYGAVDCGGYVAAFTLAACSLGVSTIAQAAIASYGPFLHEYFDIPDDRIILCGISFGYGDEEAPANSFRTHRAGLDEVVQWKGTS